MPHPRLTLRTLFVVLTLVTLPAGYYVSLCQQQKRAVAEIERLGGRVAYDYPYERRRLRNSNILAEVRMSAPSNWIARTCGPDFVHSIVEIRGFKETYTPNHTSRFANFDIHRENVPFSDDTDEALKCIRGIKVDVLDLNRTSVSTSGIAELRYVRRFDTLSLWGTSITDDALDHLRSIPGLSRVHLYETAVTENAMRELQTAMPDLEIYHESTLEQGGGRLAVRNLVTGETKALW